MLPIAAYALLALALAGLPGQSPREGEAGRLVLNAPRVGFTATPISGGRVLVAGGLRDPRSLASALSEADVFDPAFADGQGRVIGPYEFKGGFLAKRALHAAVALKDGGALLIGGDLAGSLVRFDPAAGARGEFVAAGALAGGPRVDLAAVVLADGRVFIAGGMGGDKKSSAATDLWDPKSGAVTRGPRLLRARHAHTATLLKDGRVLVAGGVGERTTEVFDPAKGTIERGPDLTTVRDDHDATLLKDGRVLIAGGQDAKARSLASAEVFDGEKWVAVASMREARSDHAQILLDDGTVLALGGEQDPGNDRDRILASVERFDPAKGAWTDCKPLAIGRDDLQAVLLSGGRVAVIAGQQQGDEPLDTIEIYRP